MHIQNCRESSGIFFSDRFCREVRRLWGQIGDDGTDTVADIQRARRRWAEEPSEKDWAIYFVHKSLVRSEDVIMIDGFPIHIQLVDKNRLLGKVLDLEHGQLIIRAPFTT